MEATISKRTPGLWRNARDLYPTPYKALQSLAPHLPRGATYYEPCAGDGAIIWALRGQAMVTCVGASDIDPLPGQGILVKDAATLTPSDIADADMFITNPPWRIELLHPIIDRLITLAPTWLLLYADWLFTRQAAAYHKHIAHVITMPRIIWIEGTKTAGFENCCWVRFEPAPTHQFLLSGWVTA